MLTSINLSDKSYDELLSEAISQIPLYSKEWTNFNISDPGITILQNLTAFQLLQQTTLNEISDQLRLQLLRLLGLRPHDSRSATLLLQVPKGTGTTLPAQYRIESGSMTYEVDRTTQLYPWSLAEAYSCHEEQYREITYLLGSRTPASAQPFGSAPQVGDSLCLVMEGELPQQTTLRLWVEVSQQQHRNPFVQGSGNDFGEVCWQYYTNAGWQDATATDETNGLLTSGEVQLVLEGNPPAVFTEAPVAGHAIRCLLCRADYDIAPRIHTMAVNLFEVVQRETMSKCYSFCRSSRVRLHGDLVQHGNLEVFCRERKGEAYKRYTPYTGITQQGRFYTTEEQPDGVVICFDRKRFGFGPGDGRNAIRVVCYDNELIHHRELGPVYGYDNQMIPLDTVLNVLPSAFSLIAHLPGTDGESDYHFIKPGNTDPDRLCYEVLPSFGMLRILQPGLGSRFDLQICDCATTLGSKGNIGAESRLFHDGNQEYINPAPGRGGITQEGVAELRKTLVRQISGATVAVLPEDYETLAMQTPGLCIHKVAAIGIPTRNLVRVVVKPYGEQKLPTLSSTYLARLTQQINKGRTITTRVEVESPVYLCIDVAANIRVKSYYENAEEQVRGLLESMLDYVNGPQRFGALVRFNDIYQRLIALPCVELVEKLQLIPRSGAHAAIAGADIQLAENCLCYPGRVRLQLYAQPDENH